MHRSKGFLKSFAFVHAGGPKGIRTVCRVTVGQEVQPGTMSAGLQAQAPGRRVDKVGSRTGVAWFVSDSGGLDMVSGFAFFVEVDQYQKSNIKNQNDKSKRKS
jgi:hypothetical protein